MKKKLFLSAAELCLSLLLIISPVSVGLSGCVYAVSEEDRNSEWSDIISSQVAEGVKQSGQWLYFDKDDHISVCGYLGGEEHITVPSEIGGKTVTELSYGGTDAEVFYSRNFFGDGGSDNDYGSMSPTKHITIPDTVTKIGAYTFYGCNLEQADLPEGLTYIGDSAFAYCGCLKKADIPSTVRIIDDMAFISTAFTSLSLHEGLEYIGQHAFSGSDITQLTVPDSVKYIGRGAFSFCWSLEEVILSKNITLIPEGIFEYSLKLRSLEIPEGVQIIEPYAFEGCSGLEALYIPSTVSIMSEMLCNNTALKDIYFNFDSKTAAAMTGTDSISYYVVYGDETDYSSVAFHYAEEAEPAPPASPYSLWDNPVRAVFLVLGITFFLTFTAALCLFLVQKSKIGPKPLPKAAVTNIPQGSVLTNSGFFDGIRCTKCGAESGKIADYCYNCGKKLKKKQ